MTSPFLPCPFTYGDAVGGGQISPMIIATRAPTANDSIYSVGYMWLDTATYTLYVLGGFLNGVPQWESGGSAPATTSSLGTVFLATTAQTASGGAPSAQYVSSANDVAAALASIVVGAGVPATIAQQGYVYLATNADAVSGVPTHPNEVLIPGNLASVFAAPPTIGGTTPAGASFTTLAASGNTTVGGTLGVTGNTTVGGTLGVTGASTLAALSATTGTFSSTLGVTGATTMAALSATTGAFSSTLCVERLRRSGEGSGCGDNEEGYGPGVRGSEAQPDRDRSGHAFAVGEPVAEEPGA